MIFAAGIRQQRRNILLLLCVVMLSPCLAGEGAWRESFKSPDSRYRPLQIIHGFDNLGPDLERVDKGLVKLEELGLGGLVVNVSFRDYMRSEAQWRLFLDGFRKAEERGFHLWLYDEDGYPSGAAGGLVLEKNEGFEAIGLMEAEAEGEKRGHRVQRMYQGTHCTENVYKKRRYINLLDQDAVAAFIDLTHGAYAKRIPEVGKHFRAIFTDEPSLMTTYIRPPDGVRPALPWVRDLPDIFNREKGYELTPHLESLYRDVGPYRGIRCDFYDVVSQLIAGRFFGQIQTWCRERGMASTGHLLAEERLVWHVAYYGDIFPSLGAMDIPGIDILNSRPADLFAGGGVLVPKLIGSAARLQGKQETMSETSDFSQQQQGRRASHREMVCTASMLYLLGINTITSYYNFLNVPERFADYKRYNDHVARLGSMLRGSSHVCDVAVLYPIAGVQANFRPTSRSMYDPHPDDTVRQIDDGFAAVCKFLLRSQIDFDVVDERSLLTAKTGKRGMSIAGRHYKALVVPPTDTLHVATLKQIGELASKGLRVHSVGLRPRFAASRNEQDERVRELSERWLGGGAFLSAVGAPLAENLRSAGCDDLVLSARRENVLVAHFTRDSSQIYFVLNTSPEATSFNLELRSVGNAFLAHPETGKVRGLPWKSEKGRLSGHLELGAYEGVFIVLDH